MVWVFGYDYNGQSGEYWNELYTYDKAWNDSSTSDTQKITGINTNNYWIQRYGVDFAPYRAMGWHDDEWRRPNQLRSGGTPVGEDDSSPMEYTNGSHPRYFYLGNRYVGVCKHCVAAVGLKTGKAVFVSATGATLEYDIQDWVSSNDSKNTGNITQSSASQVYYRSDGTTGTDWSEDEQSFWRDCRVFRLTTDPSDDGIPSIKKYVRGESVPNTDPNHDWGRAALTNYNILRISGLGVAIPFYDGKSTGFGFGGPVGGFGPAQVWSGDSGTMQFVMNPDTGEWFTSQTSASMSIPDLSNTLRIWTGDTEYETLAPFTKPTDHYYRLENPAGLGSTGATYTLDLPMINGVSAAGNLTAVSSGNTATSLFEIEAVVSKDVTPIKLDEGQDFILRHSNFGIPDSYDLWIPYASDVYSTDREIFLRIVDPNNGGLNNFTFTGAPEVIPKYGFLTFITDDGEVVAEKTNTIFPVGSIPAQIGVTASSMSDFIGTTLTANLGVFDLTGQDSISHEIFVRGFTSATGPGFTYDRSTNSLKMPVTSGTQFTEFNTFPFGTNFEAQWDQDGGHLLRQFVVGDEWVLPSIEERDGQTFDVRVNNRSIVTWNDSDGWVTLGPTLDRVLEGITYQARPS